VTGVGSVRIAIGRMLAWRKPGPWRWWTVAAALALGVVPVLLFRYLPRLWAWIAVAAIVAIVLGWVPLFGVLGLELALVSALFAAVMGADVGRAFARELQTANVEGIERAVWPGRAIASGALLAAGLAVAVALIPGVVSAVRGLWQPTCDWWFGVRSYVAMPLATAALFGATGFALGVLVGPRPVLGAALAQLPAIGVALAAVYRFYAAPPVFTYNAILGYFPGNMYDENVRLGAPLAWSRLAQGLTVIALLAVVAFVVDVPTFRARREPRPIGRRTRPLALAAVCLAGAFAIHHDAGTLGFAPDAEDLEAALDGRIETAHFIIHYARTRDIEADIQLIAADHEFRYAQVVAQLGVAPEGKLRSFYFASRDQKARLMGARDVEMAKPWRREIYIDHRAFPHESLRHEIAHAVASAFGDPLFGVASRRVLGVPMLVSPGLVEGLAVAVDWPGHYDVPTPHELVRTMQALGVQPAVGSLLGFSFFSVSSARGYTTAGSFLKFLLDEYGAERLRALYESGGDFEEAYGTSRSALENRWRTMLETIPAPANMVAANAERFRAGSVFDRPCPHAIAARRERARSTPDRARAVDIMREVCADAPGEPRFYLELGDFLSVGSELERAEALMLWTGVATDRKGVTSSLRAQAFDRLARNAGQRGDRARAKQLVAAALQLPLESTERRGLEGMALALAHTGPAGGPLRDYFFARALTPTQLELAQQIVTAEPALAYGHYLLGFNRYNANEWAGAAAELARALELGVPSEAIAKAATRRLAVAAYRAHDQARLDAAIRGLSGPRMSTSEHLLADDWAARAKFDARATSRW